jgi:hypothetical protein
MCVALIKKYVSSHNKKWRKMKTCLSYKDLVSLDFHHKLYLLQLLSKVTHTTRK